jgi:fibronectin type 3 domain-containing protein
MVGPGKKPSTFHVFRREQLKGNFNWIRPLRLIASRRDSTYFLVQDTLVQPMQFYQYYLVPMDMYGNAGVPSDTALIASFDFRSVPLPEGIRTESLDSLGGIRLTWRLREPGTVKSLKIYRSETWDSGFVQIAEVSPRDTAYVDQMTEPMKMYFYYLVMTGPLGEVSPPSARVFGTFQSALPPLPPWISRSEGVKNGVHLEIVSTDRYIAGYRIYRGRGYGEPLQLISGLIPRRDSVTVFEDTSEALSGKVHYAYAVRAENTSHLISGFSDTVYVRPLIPTQPPTPLNLTASVEGRTVQLYWEDMQPFDDALDGYVVYRREFTRKEKKQPEFKKLTDSLLSATHNRYTDTTLQVGKVYEYAVQAMDIFGGISGLSAAVRVETTSPEPIPPAGLRAMRTADGVIISWDPTVQPDLVSYRVYRYQRGQKAVLLETVKEEVPEYTDRSAKKGQLYFYIVSSVLKSGAESRPSDEVSIRP